jgi:hypothetical protein
MMRFYLAVALALLISPAADDASDFFALFEHTCAKSLTTPARFAEAAKAAGASFDSPSRSVRRPKQRRRGTTRPIGPSMETRAASRCR